MEIKKILKIISNFLIKRFIEFLGLFISILSVLLLISLLSYSPEDPNFIYTPENVKITNIGGFFGSVISDFLLQAVGLVSFLIVLNFLYWGSKLIIEKKINNFISKIFFTITYIIFGTIFTNIYYNDSFWLIDNGNGGFVGHVIKENFYSFTILIENQYVVFFIS